MIDLTTISDIVWDCAWAICLVLLVASFALTQSRGDIVAVIRAWRADR